MQPMMTGRDMNIEQFFELDEETREYLLSLHTKRKYIRSQREQLDIDLRKIKTRELNLQMECDHPNADSKYTANENEFGNLTGGGYTNYYCPDCYNRWTDKK